jgi:hypothetical protein
MKVTIRNSGYMAGKLTISNRVPEEKIQLAQKVSTAHITVK